MKAPDHPDGSANAVTPNGAQVLALAFARHGITITFGQSIPTAFHLAATGLGIRQCAYRTENAGGAMADGYARASRRVGVVTAQNGPAATLLVPPLAEAYKSSIPILALVQDVDREIADRNAFQELDHLKLFDPVVKWVRRIERASRIDDYVDMALTAATSGRPGPAVLLVPGEILTEPVATVSGRTACLGNCPLDRINPDPVATATAADLLIRARTPLVIAGGGIHTSNASAALAELQLRCHLPVATTLMGKGAVDETDPLSLGVIGYTMGEGARSEALHAMVRGADVILLVGSRSNQNGTDSWRLLPRNAQYIHLDIDGGEIGRNYESVRLAADARAGLQALTEAMLSRDMTIRVSSRERLEREITTAHAHWQMRVDAFTAVTHKPARPERLMVEINRRLRHEDIVVADASYASVWAGNYLISKCPGQRFITPRGLAGLGWGLPMAIGAAMADPTRRVLCITGDGGFAHCWAELETAVRLGLTIPIVVLNNGLLGFQRDAEMILHGAHTDACVLLPVDHARIAEACGAVGVRVESDGDFGVALDAALAHHGPTVIDVVTDPQARPPLTFFRRRLPSLPNHDPLSDHAQTSVVQPV